MASDRRWYGAVLSAAVVPFRFAYRAVIFGVFTMLVLAFCYAVGGVPRIEPPEKKNRMTQVNPD